MTQPKDIEALRKVAEEAIKHLPGEWRHDTEEPSAVAFLDKDGEEERWLAFAHCSGRSVEWLAASDFIATFDPPTVLTLLEAAACAEKAEAERDAAYVDLETLREWTLTHGATHAENIILKGRLRQAEAALVSLKGGGGSSSAESAASLADGKLTASEAQRKSEGATSRIAQVVDPGAFTDCTYANTERGLIERRHDEKRRADAYEKAAAILALGAVIPSDHPAFNVHPEEATRSHYAEAGPAFHWRGGWTFTARDDIGGVLIQNAHIPGIWLLIPRPEWRSILRAVCNDTLRRPDEDPELWGALIAAKGRVADLEAALARTGGLTSWREIESAPRDGTRIDVWAYWPEHDRCYRTTDAFWSAEHEEWQLGQFRRDEFLRPPTVTHWVPRPDPPAMSTDLSKAEGRS